MPEDGGIARGGAQQIEQDSDGGSLACAVQPEESKDLTARNFEVKMMYSSEFAVTFGQSTNRDRRGAGEHYRILTHIIIRLVEPLPSASRYAIGWFPKPRVLAVEVFVGLGAQTRPISLSNSGVLG